MSLRKKLNVREIKPDGYTGTTTFLLGHGYGCDQNMWYPAARLLAADSRCLLFDWPGAGHAQADAYDPLRHQTLDGYADDLIALLDELALPDVVYVGHSVGASIGALAAARAPGLFGQLAMLAPSPCFLNELPDYPGGFELAQLDTLVRELAEGHNAWAKAMAPLVMGNPERPALALELEAQFCLMDPTIAVRWARATFLMDVRPAIPLVRVPTLVMSCRNDALVPPGVNDWLHRHLPLGRLVALQAQGHCPHVSEPEEVAGVLRRHARWRGGGDGGTA